MPRTKKKPDVTPEPAVNGAVVGDVLTLAEAAAYLRLPEADILAAVDAQGLPGRLVSGAWRFSRAAIQQWLSAGEPTAKNVLTAKNPLNAAILAMAGAWKDDPYLEDMVEEIYRARGRPITEDGSYRLFHGLDRGEAAK